MSKPAKKPWSVAGYLLVMVVLPAMAINVLVGLVAGSGAFPPGSPVPLMGPKSACADTLISSLLMGLLTMVGVAPAAGREARGGKVRGFGWKDRWLHWVKRHPLWSAVAMGFVWLFLFGFPAAKALQWRGGDSMPRADFIAFKATFAGTFGVLAAIVAALLGLAPEPDVRKDRRWCRTPDAPVGGAVYPFDYMDKAALAITRRDRGCSGTPTWELRAHGAVDPDDVRTALADLAARYPVLTTKVQALDAVPPAARHYRYAHDARFHVSSIFDVVDARDPDVLDAVARERRSRPLDLFTDFPVTLTMAVTGDESCRFFFRQHHATADGRAFIALLLDFAAYLNDARARWRPAAKALAPVGRLGELEALGLTPGKRARYTAAGFGALVGSVLRGIFTPLTPLLQNASNDYSGENATVHWVVGDAVLEPWNAARKRLEVSLNTLLTGALMLANQRVHRARGLPLGRTNAQLLMETRPRDRPFVSFANHLGFLEAEADLAKVSDPAALLKSIQAQVVRQRDESMPIKRLLAERAFVLLVPLEQLQAMIFDTTRPAYNLNFSNLIPLEFPKLEGEGWGVDDVMITTPVAPRHGVVLTVIRYGGKLVFNFNYKTTAATRELAEELRGAFRKVMGEITGAEGETIEP